MLAEETLPEDGLGKGDGPGPVQQVRLSAHVPCRGVYALNITVSEDRYGEDIAWGFRTNCSKYLIETSRGHRDAAHEEPLVLLGPDVPGDICFRPERGAFTVELSGLNADVEPPVLYDGGDGVVAVITPDAEGNGRFTVSTEAPRGSMPWRLHLPVFRGTVHIDGVTRWPDDSDYPNFSLWTPNADSWFPFHENRWLLTPYRRTVYLNGAAEETVAFEVYNNADAPRTVRLEVEFAGESFPATLSVAEASVEAKNTVNVTLACALPEGVEEASCRLRATPQDTPEFSTYATVTLRRGIAPAEQPLNLPLVFKPYTHENELFGYLPRYPLDNQVYFNKRGQPFVVAKTALLALSDTGWRALSEVAGTDGEALPFTTRSAKCAFDADNTVYLLGQVEGRAAMLYARPSEERLNPCFLPVRGSVDLEQFSGNNPLEGPPPLVSYTFTEKDPDVFWRRLNDLHLLLPAKGAGSALSIGKPILISRKCIGFSAHSGIPSSLVSRDRKVHVVWAEATEPEELAPGVPTFVATFDRNTQQLGKPALVGYGPPANDCHNTPSITMDSQGYLHVLIGTHGRTFQYVRSLEPNNAEGGWTEPEELGPGLRQTYVGLVCDQKNTLHVVFRLWFDGGNPYFPASHYATLAYMRKRQGEPWSNPKVLLVSPFSEYSVFYHRLTIDPRGRLFLSYDCWSTYWFYRNDHHGTRRALMMSPNGGDMWKLGAMEDLQQMVP
ncbi:MAG TPA: BNR-4 repeat-containing protein [Candidatus Hydrogenedentes bacterium]|nr:BNR-4 repeat-containing protein [Candidatus Hydrogenedentota bacterium]